MPKTKIENLITHLHEQFGDDLDSPQQQQLMQQMQYHLHQLNEADPKDPGLRETAELLLENLEVNHPQAAIFVREIISLLQGMGI
jgi:hypothetical protein